MTTDNKSIFHKLVDPVTKEQLHINPNLNQLEGKHNVYPIEKNVPLLLPYQSEQLILNTPQHQDTHSSFRYVDHYQKDAVYFDYFEDIEDAASSHENRRLHETITHQVPHSCASILDVGCGNAWVASHFCPKGVAVCSFDISAQNTQRALNTYPFPNHTAVVGDVYHLPFAENSFDCIISAEVIEHAADPRKFIANLLRVVKPGGTIIITTPYKEVIPHYLCVHCNQPTPRHAHLHSFDEKKIRTLVPKNMVSNVATYAFSNKYLSKLRTHILFGYFPFKLWHLLDKWSNQWVGKQQRLLLKIVKS